MGKKTVLGGLLLFACVALVSCSSGGGSSSGSSGSGTPGSDALSVAEKVSVCDAQDAATGSISGAKALTADFVKAVSSLPTTSAYATDTTNTYVEERSADSFSRINQILCSMAQTRYTDMMNHGDYKAQIDTSQCGQDKDSAKGAGQASQNQSTGQNATSYETWTVNSSRATDQPHIVKVWMHEEASSREPAKTININIQISEGVSPTNPIGIFTANFKGCLDTDADCASPMMAGYLKAEREDANDVNSDVLLKFFVNGGSGDFTFTEQATLNKDVDANAGSGSVNISDFNEYDGAISKAFDIAYNDSYFYRAASDGSEAACLDRKNFNTNVWRYGLYYDENHATPGARVLRGNPGFSIKYDSGGQMYYGFAGYYGVSLPGEASLSSGATVYKQDYSAAGTTETPYTVFIADGRLQKHVKKTVTLGEIKNVPLSWSVCEQSGDSWECLENRVKWNGTQLLKDATRSQATSWMWKNLAAAELVTFSESDFSFNFYSESLGGDGRIDLMNKDTGEQLSASSLTDATEVIFHKINTVYPGDTVPATLACFENCMDPSTINSENPYFAESTYMGGENNFNMVNMYPGVAPAELVAGTNFIAYTFDTDTMLLRYGAFPVVLTDNSNQQNGVWGGALFDPTSADNLNALACDWDNSKTCVWQVWDLATFYTWETGADEWNKLTALKDANGQYISFDPPLMVEYTRSSTGAKYFLEYNGFGDIWGIPGICIDADTGLEVACYEEGVSRNVRWVPEFSIAAGSSMTDVSNNLTYYVKPLEQEQQMIAVDVSACTGAGLSLVNYALPDATLVVDPGIGTEPTVDAAPAVIGGVLQE